MTLQSILIILLQIIVLILAVYPLLHMCLNRPFIKAFPKFAVLGYAAFTAYSASLIFLAFVAPQALVIITVLAALLIALERWRAQPNFGRKKGLPPGSLALLPLQPLIDETYLQQQAQRFGPVFKISHFFKPMVCVLGFTRGYELLSQHSQQMGSPVDPFSHYIPKGYIRYMQTQDHCRLRAVLQSAFSKHLMLVSKEHVRVTMHAALLSMAHNCAQFQEQGVQPKAYLSTMMFNINLYLFFGITQESTAYGPLNSMYEVIDYARRRPITVVHKKSAQQVAETLERMTAILGQRVDLMQQSSDNLQPGPVCVLSEIFKTHPQFAKDPTVLMNLIFMVRVAGEDMVGLLMWLLKMLSDETQWTARLQKELSSGEKPTVGKIDWLDCFILETLRLRQSEYIYRYAKQDIHFDGFLIPKGWMIRVCVRETHRLPEVFENPNAFNPQRMREKKYSKSEYAPFGLAQHNCIGQYMVKRLAKTFLQQLLLHFDCTKIHDGPVEYHGWHWAPNSDFAIDINVSH